LLPLRLFVAIAIPSEVRDALSQLLQDLRGIAPKAKWVRAENLHVTLKFLGNTDAQKLEEIESALETVRSSQAVTLDFRGLGFFPNEKRPRVFWGGMEASANLRPLAESVDRCLHQVEFPVEERPFVPHLTLARFDPPGLPPALAEAVKKHCSENFGKAIAREFHLIESKLKSTGAEYTTIQSFPFVTES
jgi:RNA 2',3'-cyclic 3'-phosphodiesterase